MTLDETTMTYAPRKRGRPAGSATGPRVRGEVEQFTDVDPGLVSLAKWRKQVGRSESCVYGWIKKGLLKTVIICGKPYVTTQEITRFTWAAEDGLLKDK